MKRAGLVLVAVSFASIALIPCRAQAPAPAVPPVPRIATVNPEEIFEKIHERKDRQADMDAQLEKLKEEDALRRCVLTEVGRSLDVLGPGIPRYEGPSTDYRRQLAEYEAWHKLVFDEARRAQKAMLIAIHNKIVRAVEEQARKSGYDLVIAKSADELPKDVTGYPVNELRARFTSRTILYDACVSDLTQAVIAEMDRAYANGPAH